MELESSEEVGFHHVSISGPRLFSLHKSVWANGVLHPNAVRPLSPELLPQVTFGDNVVDQADGAVELAWPMLALSFRTA